VPPWRASAPLRGRDEEGRSTEPVKLCSTSAGKAPRRLLSRQEGGAKGRRARCKECFKAITRAAYARSPAVQERRREILEKWRQEGSNP
jgi:hypothetical protein